MMGIVCKWECPSCGNVLTTTAPFWDDKTRKNVEGPKSCACGRKGKFNLLDFGRCKYTVLPKGTKVVDMDGRVIDENPDPTTKKEPTEKTEE